MVANKKPAFVERSVSQIRRMKPFVIPYEEFSIKQVIQLPRDKSILIDCSTGPGFIGERFKRTRDKNLNKAAMRYYRDTEAYVKVTTPQSREQAISDKLEPRALFHAFASEAFEGFSAPMNIGMSYYPIIGTDRRLRLMSLVSIAEGTRIASHSFRLERGDEEGINVAPYERGREAYEEGAAVLVQVPSTDLKGRPYVFQFRHVPTLDTDTRWAQIWSLNAESAEGSRGEPMHTIGTIDFKDVFRWNSHKIAGYLGIARNQLRNGNSIPLDMCPFPILSRRGAEVYDKIINNVLIKDRLPNGRLAVHKPYLVQKCEMLGSDIDLEGYQQTFSWNSKRDGPIKNYDWQKIAA